MKWWFPDKDTRVADRFPTFSSKNDDRKFPQSPKAEDMHRTAPFLWHLVEFSADQLCAESADLATCPVVEIGFVELVLLVTELLNRWPTFFYGKNYILEQKHVYIENIKNASPVLWSIFISLILYFYFFFSSKSAYILSIYWRKYLLLIEKIINL